MPTKLAKGRPERPSLPVAVDGLRDRFDHLCADIAIGIRDQRHFEQLDEEAHAIADGLKAAFRGMR